MLTTIEGIYNDGDIELLEAPTDVHQARILVTFLDKIVSPQTQNRPIQFGQFTGGRESTDADFKLAEWHVMM